MILVLISSLAFCLIRSTEADVLILLGRNQHLALLGVYVIINIIYAGYGWWVILCLLNFCTKINLTSFTSISYLGYLYNPITVLIALLIMITSDIFKYQGWPSLPETSYISNLFVNLFANIICFSMILVLISPLSIPCIAAFNWLVFAITSIIYEQGIGGLSMGWL